MNCELTLFLFSLKTLNHDLEDQLTFVTAAIRDKVFFCWHVNLIYIANKDVTDRDIFQKLYYISD